MIFTAKLGAVLAAALLGTGAVCTCPPPEVETISCYPGPGDPHISTIVSWPGATCAAVAIAHVNGPPEQITLRCPAGETAISGGYRIGTLAEIGGGFNGQAPAAPAWMTPLAPAGGHATGYRFIWSQNSHTSNYRVYVTCERL